MHYKENAMIPNMKRSISIAMLFIGLLAVSDAGSARAETTPFQAQTKHSSTTEIHSTVSIITVPDLPLVQANPVLIGPSQAAVGASVATPAPAVSFWTKVKNFFGRFF